MKKVLTFIVGALVAVVAVVALSLALTGQPAFGLLAGTGLQGKIVPGPVRALFAGEEADGEEGGGGRRGGPVPVTAASVERRSVPDTLSFSGRIIARRTVEIRARVTGYVSEIAFEEATFVREGAVLYRIDPRTFEAEVAQLEATLEGARANLEFLRRETGRIAELDREGFAETSRLDELSSQRADAAARVDELQAQLRRARLDLDFAVIKAPFTGKVDFSEVDVGDLATAGETRLTTLVEYDPIEVEFRPSAPELSRLRGALRQSADPLAVVVEMADDVRREGTLEALAPSFDRSTNTIPVRARLPNGDRALVPGQFARVTARLGEREALVVPTTALVANQNKRAVYRIGEDGSVEVVPVETGETLQETTVVRGPLSAGDRIVTGNLQSVRPGRKVRVRESAGAGGPDRVARGGEAAGGGER